MKFARMFCAAILSWVGALAATSSSFAAMAAHDVAPVDWQAAIHSLRSDVGHPLEELRRLRGYAKAAVRVAPSSDQSFASDLQTINAVSSLLRPNIHRAGSPVLLPMDFRRLITEMERSGEFTNKDNTDAYFAPLRSVAFHPGPYGYRAYFRFDKGSSVIVAGSSLFYRLIGATEIPQLELCETIVAAARREPVAAAQADRGFFDYIGAYAKRIGLVDAKYFGEREAVIPCLFAGALVEISILCDAKVDPECRAQRFARAVIANLEFVGGSPRPASRPVTNDPVRHLVRVIDGLDRDAANAGPVRLPDYGMPGDLLPGSGVDGRAGSRDFGVYGAILFPTDLDAAAQTVIYRADQTCIAEMGVDQGTTCLRNGTKIAKVPIGQWRDDFCEYRSGYRLFTCPAGRGHAGQDVWGDWVGQPGMHRLRAVTDGIAFRRFSTQPALTISDVNGTNIDYIYRHLRPSELTRHGIPPSRPRAVFRGCVLGFVDRLDRVSETATDLVDNDVYYEATAPHLHFEIRVPTAAGFQLVSPYWTLVEAHRFRQTGAESVRLTNRPCGLYGHRAVTRSAETP